MSCLEDRNLAGIESIPPPNELKLAHPISETAAGVVLRARSDIRDVLHGRDHRRQVVVVGPCSLHDPVVALEIPLIDVVDRRGMGGGVRLPVAWVAGQVGVAAGP